jgi:tetratricopeptide (TPR) repeat protein
MLRRTDHAIARRASELVDQASRLIGAGRAADALPVLEQARALDPHAPGLEQAFAAHARATQPAPPVTATPAPAAAPAPRSGPRWSDAQAEQFYQQGLAAAREQRLDDALRLWELVWSSRPGYRQVNALLVREYLTRGIDAFAAGRLTEAIASWEKVLRVDPTDARAKGYLARAQQQLARSRAIPEAR